MSINAGGVLAVKAKLNCALCVYVAADRPGGGALRYIKKSKNLRDTCACYGLSINTARPDQNS